MFQEDAFVGTPEFDGARRAIGSLFEPLGQADQIGGREGLGESVVRTNLATHERDSDVPMYADDPIRLGLDPRCPVGVDLELTALLPSKAHAAMVGRPVRPGRLRRVRRRTEPQLGPVSRNDA